MCLWFGVVPYLVIQLTVLLVAGSVGVYLFYLQHQFEDVYWERGKDWDYVAAALQGSSFFKLPKVLQWFSGNIGFHHVHHYSSRIPNYHLERAHTGVAEFQEVGRLIAEVLDAVAQSPDGAAPLVEAAVKGKVRALTDRFPIYRS